MDSQDFWQNVKDTVRGSVKEVQERGEVLAQQGRLRFDIFGLQRRLDRQLESLGRFYANRVQEGKSVLADDPEMASQLAQIQTIEAELAALREKLRLAARKSQA